MRQVEELADRLVQYDRELAADIVRLIVEELGGGRPDAPRTVARAHAFLSRLDAASVGADEPKTTAEWKIDFAHRERLRALGLLLAELLDQ